MINMGVQLGYLLTTTTTHGRRHGWQGGGGREEKNRDQGGWRDKKQFYSRFARNLR